MTGADSNHTLSPMPMRLVIPHSPPRGSPGIVRAVVESQGYVPEMELCVGPEDYYHLLSRLWADGESFIIVEHDVLPWPGALDALVACEKPWCSFPYLIGGRYDLHHTLGCTRFTASFIADCPWMWEVIGRQERARHWSLIDDQLAQLAKLNLDAEPHRHEPPVIHLNPDHFPSVDPQDMRERLKA